LSEFMEKEMSCKKRHEGCIIFCETWTSLCHFQ
jgi:hypothetical protein